MKQTLINKGLQIKELLDKKLIDTKKAKQLMGNELVLLGGLKTK